MYFHYHHKFNDLLIILLLSNFLICYIAPRIITAAVYKHLGETMEFLWDKDLKINTVHVADVCSALWFLGQNGKVGEAYNLADTNDTGMLSFVQLIINYRYVRIIIIWNWMMIFLILMNTFNRFNLLCKFILF